MIPFYAPTIVGHEFEYLKEVLNSKKWGGDGSFTKRCEEFLQKHAGAKKSLLTTSCTDALEMAALLLNIEPGDEVICPSYTFVSTINAFMLRGATPVFADVRPDTFNIDEKQLAKKITKKTKAILVVHYAGVACEMDTILSIAKLHGIPVIEDNAHGLFGTYKGQQLGTMGRLSTLSFHESKNFSSGEGGALMLNLMSDIDRADVLREKGTNRRRFFQGQVDKYTWVDLGSSFLPSEITAAVLFAQLESRDMIQSRRAEIWHKYNNELQSWAREWAVRLPFIPTECEQTFHMFYLVTPNIEWRTEFIAHMKARDIGTSFHYQSLHLSEMGLKYGGRVGDCPVTEMASECLVRLPLWNKLSDEQVEKVCDAALSFQPQVKQLKRSG
jgi:dTDP-4-amino-4,6-dideoxygalactose transaminase